MEDNLGGSNAELLEPQAAPAAWGRRRAIAAGVGLLMMGTVAMATLSASPTVGRSSGGSAPVALATSSVAEIIGLADAVSSSAAGYPGMPVGTDDDPPLQVQPEVNGKPMNEPPVDKSPSDLSVSCADNEELFMSLCYKKCAVLTNLTHPKRVAPGACCKELSISCLNPSKTDYNGIFPGQGYNVGGDNGPPHPPGACDGNEENHLGLCYMKCNLLTDNEYPIRAAANTCCKAHPCWNIFNLKSSPGTCTGYGVGGGNAGHDCPHQPSTVGSR